MCFPLYCLCIILHPVGLSFALNLRKQPKKTTLINPQIRTMHNLYQFYKEELPALGSDKVTMTNEKIQ